MGRLTVMTDWDELVPRPLPHADWEDVLGRTRQNRRRIALSVAVLVALAIVPTALAFGDRVADWFHGKPAPRSIRQDFVGRSARIAPRTGSRTQVLLTSQIL